MKAAIHMKFIIMTIFYNYCIIYNSSCDTSSRLVALVAATVTVVIVAIIMLVVAVIVEV